MKDFTYFQEIGDEDRRVLSQTHSDIILCIMIRAVCSSLLFLALFIATGCSSDAVTRGVGSECTTDTDCTEEGQVCLSFKGGYCGISGCTANAGCPSGSACVTHTDSTNYCFLQCTEKVDCNVNRTTENESNCSSNITWVESETTGKACVPPSAS